MLDDLKVMLGYAKGEELDEKLSDRLTLILNSVSARLKVRLGGVEPPDELSYIIVDVAAARYNKIGSEGLSAHSVEGESLTFTSGDEFNAYEDDIQSYLDSLDDATKGKVRFL